MRAEIARPNPPGRLAAEERLKLMEKYQHDCGTCCFLGHGPAPILSVGKTFDFYVCTSGIGRSFIARFGNRPEEYMSGPLLGTAELSRLDLVALFNGLELTPEEDTRLLRRLADMYRSKLSVRDYEKFSTGSRCVFGTGNALFPTI